jgi:NAD(P)H-dependent FMN reductase
VTFNCHRFSRAIICTPEYNHGICGALKNAIDYVFREWNNKAAGHGGAGSVRAVEHLKKRDIHHS